MLNIAESAVTTGTRMYVNSLSRERYRINYVYGFSSGGFSYFMTTQMKNTETAIYMSKLVRVCQDDQHYYSFTEIPINCTNEGINYNLVQAAYVGKAGSVLAENLGITAQEDVLFAVFSQSDLPSNDIPLPLSALCVYSLKAIRRKFMTNIQKCFSGLGHRGLDYVSPSHKCISTVSDVQASFLVFRFSPSIVYVRKEVTVVFGTVGSHSCSLFLPCGSGSNARSLESAYRTATRIYFSVLLSVDVRTIADYFWWLFSMNSNCLVWK